eukprot:419160-Prymnesium_polylepis.1
MRRPPWGKEPTTRWGMAPWPLAGCTVRGTVGARAKGGVLGVSPRAWDDLGCKAGVWRVERKDLWLASRGARAWGAEPPHGGWRLGVRCL